MVSKLGDVYITVNTDENIFYSAYLKGKIQYNGVDPDKLKMLQNEVEMVDIESVGPGPGPVAEVGPEPAFHLEAVAPELEPVTEVEVFVELEQS